MLTAEGWQPSPGIPGPAPPVELAGMKLELALNRVRYAGSGVMMMLGKIEEPGRTWSFRWKLWRLRRRVARAVLLGEWYADHLHSLAGDAARAWTASEKETLSQ